MKNGLKLIFNMTKVFLLFSLCTIIFYYGMIWVHQEYQNYQRYQEPEGAAVKVFGDGEQQVMTSYERFIYFFLHGE